jgi:4-diphosphocytidyl-2-C-methyl-D-erythritol kinase
LSAEDVRVFAPAKINLFLHVGARRADGFHDIESLAAFADIGDELSVQRAKEFSLALDGPFAGELAADGSNLVLRAARTLSSSTGLNVAARILLTKNLPVSSGLGGGSADAAAALRGLARLWGVLVSASDLHAIAGTLGSDVAVCLASSPSWMEGRGELLSPVPDLPQTWVVLVNPGIAISTGAIFAALKDRNGVGGPKPLGWQTRGALVDFLKKQSNDLEQPARLAAPAIGEALGALSSSKGALLARMSGSGATCFGLFGEESEAAAAAVRIGQAHPQWWVKATLLAPLRPGQ